MKRPKGGQRGAHATRTALKRNSLRGLDPVHALQASCEVERTGEVDAREMRSREGDNGGAVAWE